MLLELEYQTLQKLKDKQKVTITDKLLVNLQPRHHVEIQFAKDQTLIFELNIYKVHVFCFFTYNNKGSLYFHQSHGVDD